MPPVHAATVLSLTPASRVFSSLPSILPPFRTNTQLPRSPWLLRHTQLAPMASSFIPDGAQDALLILATLVYPFPLPKGKKGGAAFAKAFSATGTPAATTATMESIDKLREEFVDEVSKPKPSMAAVSSAADRYAPQLHRIIQSIDASHDPVRLTQRMQFQWTSALNAHAPPQEYKTQEVFIFEMAMLLSSKALAQSNQASLLLSSSDPSSPDNHYADAATLLKSAGGVYLALAHDFLPRWKETPENASGRHPETSEGVAMALVDLVSAQAQTMYLAKGVNAGNVPKGTLAKLAVTVVERFEKCVSNFRARAGTHFGRLDPEFLGYLTFMPALYRALAYRFLAVAHWEKSDHGTAIGLLLQAQVLLKPRADGVSSGLPSMEDSRFLIKYKPQVEIMRKEINGMLTSWKQDNSMIYFAAIVDAMSLPPLPAGANMVQLTKYDYVSSLPPILFSEPAVATTGTS